VLTLLNLLAKGDVVRAISQLIRDTVTRLYALSRETQEPAWKKLPRHPAVPPDELAAAREALESLVIPNKSIMKEVEKDRYYLANNELRDFISRGYAAKLLAGETSYHRKPITDDVRELYETILRHVKHKLVNRLADQTEATYDLLLHFRQHYERLKHAQAALRFDDISFALSQGKAAQVADDERVSFRLDAAIDHLLLDEFQDTSLAQWSVLQPIARRVASSRGDTSFFCVGDTKQAIYGWRGGLAELFDAVQNELPDLQPSPLNVSYRSSPAVIEVVNRTFAGLDRHDTLGPYEAAVRSWQREFPEHSTTKTDLAGYVTLETCERVEVDDDTDPLEAANEAFLDFAADRIATAWRESPGRTIGVLTRTNRVLAGLIYRLRKMEVPASEEGGNPLVDSCAVELILSLVRLADHPGDTAAAYHVARSPLADAFEITPEDFRRCGVLAKKLRRELIDSGYGRTIHRWSQLLAPACDARDRNRLQQLVELAYAYQPHSTLRPADFLEYVEQQKVADPSSAAVRVMTVHQAKGLEFDIVFLPELDAGRALMGMPPTVVSSRNGAGGDVNCVCRYTNEHEQKLLPQSFQEMFSASDDAQINEALCVLYVAMTRAIHALHLLIQPPRDNERETPKTFAGLLRAALCEGDSRDCGLLFEHGQSNWHEIERKRLKRARMEASVAPAATGHTRIMLAAPPVERRRGLERQRPSGMEGGSAGQIRRALALVDPQQSRAMLRGTIIHKWFEQILWLDGGIPSDEQLLASLALVRDIHVVDDGLRRAWLKDFHGMLQHKGNAAVLTRSTYSTTLPKAWQAADADFEVRNEWPFAVIDGHQIMKGQMDRVVIHRRRGQRVAAEVIDFKTDSISDKRGERIDDRVEEYRPQIEAYCKTLVQQTGLPAARVSGVLLFVGAGAMARL
jgi:ATP-dependent exoDNAse (exonuclease V) beta subunit